MRIARLKYVHSDPLFAYSGLDPISVSNNDSIKLLLEGAVDVAFVPVTYASMHCDQLIMIPAYAIYSRGPVISARLFKGLGKGYAAVEDTSVNALALSKLMGIKFDRVSDPIEALNRYEGVLAIGDQALRMVDRGYRHIVDVGELWEMRVGKPLVYAIMVLRRSINYDDDELRNVLSAISKSLDTFMKDPEPLIRNVATRLGVSESLVRDYLMRGIRYIVDELVIEGLSVELSIFELPNCLQALDLGYY